jgi:hypothetical protein
MLSLYAYAFGSYGASLFPPESHNFWKHILISVVIFGITGLNLLNAKLIGEAEDWIVLVKLTILTLFIITGLSGVDPARLAPATWSPPLNLLAGGMIIFLAYEGFELIANTARDAKDGAKTLPRAFYSSVGVVILLYILVAAVTVGTLSVDQIVAAKDYALAVAAKPFLGHTGFLLIAIAAMLSTASAINATIYGSARLSYVIAKDGELPSLLERKAWGEPIGGLLITSGTALLIANLADLSSLSTMGSAGFLLIFAAVNAANLELADETGSKRWLALLGVLLCLGALGSLIWYTFINSPSQLWILLVMVGAALGIELSFRLATGRIITLPKS